MDSVDRIENLIVADSEGFFDEPSFRETLHIPLRIARDFFDFLVQHGERPAAKEIDYMMGTIRSGMDQFFELAYLYGTINQEKEAKFDRQVHGEFPALRERFLRDFERLAQPSRASVGDRLASLLFLTHLELVFLSQQFPCLKSEE
jgi:hypothetical protein